jgi:hypothetical protein
MFGFRNAGMQRKAQAKNQTFGGLLDRHCFFLLLWVFY